MIEIEGAQYGKCAYCLRWFPIDEMRWDDEVLFFVCWEGVALPGSLTADPLSVYRWQGKVGKLPLINIAGGIWACQNL